MTNDTADGAAQFLAWLQDHGADTSRLRWPVTDGNGRKAVATQDIQENDYALRVPEALMMSPSKALKSEIGDCLLYTSDAADE